ncbi:YgiT-type zinc finger protein [Bacillus sp. AG4(2022)]|uniref:YgiT-type zinc finger protein n=1 Tax=Bacillus sp. AG4(2022) TaxID=2962594 RepID=UPI002880D0DD|nr:YgiT-type zinc finger protein [Bacillus sp. AG4(2022)]MDT0160326.1 YgiT-type zinc finger protein [Bacillus sp. AG4(2022)]
MGDAQCSKCKELNEKLGYTEHESYEAICDNCWDKRVDEHSKEVKSVMNCYCGRELKKSINSVITQYKGKQITVLNVPVYSCEMDHIRLDRKTRVLVKESLERAYVDGASEVSLID